MMMIRTISAKGTRRTLCQITRAHLSHFLTVCALRSKKIEVVFYHGGKQMSQEKRDDAQRRFQDLSNDVNVMVANEAYGMGINHPGIRRIVHYGVPKDLETYYNQIGLPGLVYRSPGMHVGDIRKLEIRLIDEISNAIKGIDASRTNVVFFDSGRSELWLSCVRRSCS